MAEVVPAESYATRMEAEFAKSYLEAEGIPAMVSGDDAGGWQPFMLPGGGGVRLMVLDTDLEKARAILRTVEDANPP